MKLKKLSVLKMKVLKSNVAKKHLIFDEKMRFTDQKIVFKKRSKMFFLKLKRAQFNALFDPKSFTYVLCKIEF